MLLKSKIIGKGSDILIVLHGFLGMSDNWNSFAKKIYNQGFQIHLLDQQLCTQCRNPAFSLFYWEIPYINFSLFLFCSDIELKVLNKS